jgi:ABC-type dipeptide/oligopeptide/nickel transport system ATPase subunit
MDSLTKVALEARGLCKTFTQGRWWQKRLRHCALDDVSLTLRQQKTLALVGKSGSGKTTLAMCLVGLEQPERGEILLNGRSLQAIDKPSTATVRREIQLIFQDSNNALNPRMSAMEIVEEPLLICRKYSRKERWEVATAMMERVGIPSKWSHRLPSELSGGQRQRLAIARALVLQPKVLILDEIFVGFDLSIQNQIANLLLELQQIHGLSYLCITHNLGLMSRIADTIAIMEKGHITEEITPTELLGRTRISNGEASIIPRHRPSALGTSMGA